MLFTFFHSAARQAALCLLFLSSLISVKHELSFAVTLYFFLWKTSVFPREWYRYSFTCNRMGRIFSTSEQRAIAKEKNMMFFFTNQQLISTKMLKLSILYVVDGWNSNAIFGCVCDSRRKEKGKKENWKWNWTQSTMPCVLCTNEPIYSLFHCRRRRCWLQRLRSSLISHCKRSLGPVFQFNFQVIISFNFKYKHYSWQMWYPFIFANTNMSTHEHTTKVSFIKGSAAEAAATAAVKEKRSLRIRFLHTFRQFINRHIWTLVSRTHIHTYAIVIIKWDAFIFNSIQASTWKCHNHAVEMCLL